MAATAEMIKKINALDSNDLGLVIHLVDYLSQKEPVRASDENVFRKAREACREHWMDDEQIEEFVDSARAERNASSH